MEYINEVNLNEAIIHVLDNNGTEPVYNEYPLKLVDETYEYILKHIQKSLKDEELKYAIFNDDSNIVKEISQEYFNAHTDLISASKEMAKQLFALMKSNSTIPSCDLIVVSISTEYGLMLAILKMDYVKNYTHTIDFVEDKIGINITPQFVGLPPGGQRLQKCAFIKPIKDENKFDVMVIDKQSKSKESRESEGYDPNYFISNFLGCTVVDNERDATRNFIKTTEKWTRDNLKDNADKAEQVRTSIKTKLKEEDSININELSQDIFGDNADVSQNFVQYAKERGVSENIEVDKQWIENKFKRVRLKIDKQIDIYIDEEVYGDKTKFEVVRNGDGTIDMRIKHVKNYIEK
ncbi:nucleoid-associated protein [Clostridium akagii]|uniref:nucleoid-associated protein n=1 Tax=Clostridium akagii TaxID=91623 RepID=UPI00047E24C0|nr:nucleoid-associated protein [Clostridium akagii]